MRPSLAGISAGSLSGVMAFGYLSLLFGGDIGQEGDRGQALVVAVILVTLPVASVVGAMKPAETLGIGLLAYATGGMLIMSMVTMATVGFPLVIASMLAASALLRSIRGRARIRREVEGAQEPDSRTSPS